MFVENLHLLSGIACMTAIVVLYIGPETFMPLLSALAAAAGILLMFWRNMLAFFRKLFRGSQAESNLEMDATEASQEQIEKSA